MSQKAPVYKNIKELKIHFTGRNFIGKLELSK